MKLDKLFCDGVVFAEGKPLRVFGESDGRVTVKFCGVETTAGPENGRWIAEFPAMSAGGPYELEVCGDGKTVLVSDVYVGRVYLVAGQSNAELQLFSSDFSWLWVLSSRISVKTVYVMLEKLTG